MMSKRISTGIGSTARHRRLEIHRMRSVRTTTTTTASTTTTAAMNNRSTESGGGGGGGGGVGNTFAVSDDVCTMKRRRAIADVTSSESTSTSTKKSKMGLGESKSEITHSGSSSSPSENEGVPLGILVPGGELSGENESRSLACLSHGSISVIGRRREMEDAVTVAPGILAGEFASYDFFAVYDGHGGSRVSLACRDRMHQLLADELEVWTRGGGEGGGVDWEIAMATCFKKMDDEVSVGCGGDGDQLAVVGLTSTAAMGSTAVVVVVGEKEIVVANCGDSRAVLCRNGFPVPLSRDHKPDRPDERERVEAAGGKIINWNGCRVLGVLATSRSIGDQYLKPYVISEPEVTVIERTESDGFIIVASDGLWDVLSNEVACEVVRRCLGGQVKRRFAEEVNGSYSMEAAAMLAELAMARGSKDNISVIVVELKRLLETPLLIPH